MTGPEILNSYAGHLRTRMGACLPGERAIFRQHDLHAELGDIDWIALYVLGITGRRFSPPQVRLLHAIWTHTSYPDARIWNNRVAALAGSTRTTGNLGIAAALAISEASIYGRGIDIRAADFLIRTRQKLEQGCLLADCIKMELDTHRSIAGYGRPITSGDERNGPIMDLARSLGLADGPHVALACAIDDFLLKGRWRLRMNYAALAAALCADFGLSPREYYLFLFPAFLAGMPPCYIEAMEKPAGCIFPTPCGQVQYEGRDKRAWRTPENIERD